tara:strand:- start:39 stop:614 length:576 start_codon:yes stop_codon:yes gene_type:complete
MKKMNVEKSTVKKFNKFQKTRVENILNLIRPNMKKIKADHLCTLENAHKIMNLSSQLSGIHLDMAIDYEENNVLKKCRKAESWYLLHLVNFYSASGQKCYKENLVKNSLFKHQSTKTTYKDIDKLIKDKIFIEMPEFRSDGVQNGYKNLRPSEEVAGAYLDWNVKNLLCNLKFINENTKINIKLDLDKNDI